LGAREDCPKTNVEAEDGGPEDGIVQVRWKEKEGPTLKGRTKRIGIGAGGPEGNIDKGKAVTTREVVTSAVKQ